MMVGSFLVGALIGVLIIWGWCDWQSALFGFGFALAVLGTVYLVSSLCD